MSEVAVGVIIVLAILGFFGHRWFRRGMERREDAVPNSKLESEPAE